MECKDRFIIYQPNILGSNDCVVFCTRKKGHPGKCKGIVSVWIDDDDPSTDESQVIYIWWNHKELD